MFLIAGAAFLALLSATLFMLWAHERIHIKKITPHASIEECWDGSNRRGHPRFKNKIEVEYSVEKKARLKSAKSVNISQGGMKLLMDEKLQNGTVIDLKIEVPETRKIIEVEGEVVWSKDFEIKDPTGKRFFNTGIKFIAIKEPQGIHLSEYLAALESKPSQKYP